MEQEGGNMNRQQGEGQVTQEAQKCPRCDSDNTKFCYYNNYSFAQPRYLCKTCRRYWTQGGTLRNIPVGGGCRRGKRAKNSSSSAATDNSSSSRAPQQPLTTAVRGRDPSLSLGGEGGGYLSSLAAIHNPLNQSHPFNANQSLSSSNMGLLSGFNVAASSVQRQFRPSPFYSGEREQMMSLYGAGQGLVPPQNVWPQTQSFINNSSSDLWSTISTTSSISQSQRSASAASASDSDSANAAAASSSFFNNQWHDLSGYNPHHP